MCEAARLSQEIPAQLCPGQKSRNKEPYPALVHPSPKSSGAHLKAFASAAPQPTIYPALFYLNEIIMHRLLELKEEQGAVKEPGLQGQTLNSGVIHSLQISVSSSLRWE